MTVRPNIPAEAASRLGLIQALDAMTSSLALLVRKLKSDELDWANQRYREVDFLPSPPSDLIAVAEVAGSPAGLGRVTPISETAGELGGMYVFPEHRGGGISSALVRYLIEESGRDILYCLPFIHLRGLYEGLGFRLVSPNQHIPSHVVEKHLWCNQHYSNPVLMMWRDNACGI